MSVLTLSGYQLETAKKLTDAIRKKTEPQEILDMRFNYLATEIFDIDFSKISIDERNITPLNTVNSVKCSIVKVREKNRKYTFYFDIAGELAEIEHVIREKLFAARGIEIFDTEPELIFDAFAVAAEKSDNPSRYAFLALISSTVFDRLIAL